LKYFYNSNIAAPINNQNYVGVLFSVTNMPFKIMNKYLSTIFDLFKNTRIVLENRKDYNNLKYYQNQTKMDTLAKKLFTSKYFHDVSRVETYDNKLQFNEEEIYILDICEKINGNEKEPKDHSTIFEYYNRRSVCSVIDSHVYYFKNKETDWIDTYNEEDDYAEDDEDEHEDEDEYAKDDEDEYAQDDEDEYIEGPPQKIELQPERILMKI
jgi:hypothetical protein